MLPPKVSVIIPNYNHSKFLKKRIESVLNQTFKDFEIIILDDNSTDNSREIIEIFRSHQRVSKIIYNKYNSGSTFKQWYKGICESEGEYIWIAESDDFAEPNFLDVLVKLLDEHVNLGLAYCQSYRIDESDRILNVLSTSSSRWDQQFVRNGRDELLEYLILNNTIPNASAVLFRRKIADLINKKYLEFKYCGDRFFWSNMLILSDIAYSPIKMNYFRDHSQNVSRKYNKNGLQYIEGLQIINFIKDEIGFSQLEYNRIKYHWSDKLLLDVLNSSFDFKTFIKIITKKSHSFNLFYYFLRSCFSFFIKKCVKIFELFFISRKFHI